MDRRVESVNETVDATWSSTVPPGETVTSQLSPSSPTEDSSGDLRTDRPRLQRSMGQSKKTFRLRRSRKSHFEVTKFMYYSVFPSLRYLQHSQVWNQNRIFNGQTNVNRYNNVF